MPLLIFEITCRFPSENMKWLFNNLTQEKLESEEGKFQLKSLMLFECLEVENDGNWLFCGVNNTLFDEAVYTSNHLLRAPGVSKAITNDVPALAPWHPGSLCLVTSRRFSDYFSGDDNGLTSWSDHLVGSPVTRTVWTLSYVIAGSKPSSSYLCPHRWYANWRGACNRVNIEHVIDMVIRNNADLPRYTEARKTKVAHRLLTNQERSNAMRGVESCDPNELVCPDKVFRGEDGKYKPFRLFCPGDAFFMCIMVGKNAHQARRYSMVDFIALVVQKHLLV